MAIFLLERPCWHTVVQISDQSHNIRVVLPCVNIHTSMRPTHTKQLPTLIAGCF